MMLRDHTSTHRQTGESRLNLLVSYAGWRETSFADQLPRLLDPMGISCIRAGCGVEATNIIQSTPVHIAIVDLDMPLQQQAADNPSSRSIEPAGARVLQLLRRLDPAPPTVVVRPPQPASRENTRSLSAALREGAFAVLDRPVDMETLLEVMRRILCRYYADNWPTHSA